VAPYLIQWAVKRKGDWKGSFKESPKKFKEI
jgi:hypothetical protein